MRNFDSEFSATRRAAMWGLVLAFIFKLAALGALIWLAVYAIDTFAA